jgi:hypothetical protein
MRRPFLLIVMLGTLALVQPALGCPACKDSIAGGDSSATASADADGSGPNVSSGFNQSIYLMFVAFFGVTGLISYTLIRGARGVGRGLDETDKK